MDLKKKYEGTKEERRGCDIIEELFNSHYLYLHFTKLYNDFIYEFALENYYSGDYFRLRHGSAVVAVGNVIKDVSLSEEYLNGNIKTSDGNKIKYF